MTPNPQFHFNAEATGEDVAVASSSVVTATVTDLDGVRQVEWYVAGTDETSSPDDYVLALSGPRNSVCTFTALGDGTAGALTCRVNGGIDQTTGQTNPLLWSTQKFYVATATGLPVRAEGEDASATAREIAVINAAVRAVDAGGGGGGSGGVTNDPVRCVTTGNVNLAACAQVQDGVTLVSTNRIGVVAQTDAKQNGIYTSGTPAGGLVVLTRAADFDTTPEILSGAAFFVQEGTLYAGATATLVTPDPITLGATNLTFRLDSAFQLADRTRYDQTERTVNTTPIALTNASQTITVAGGRRYRQTTPLAYPPPAKTLGTTGAVVGDIITLETDNTSPYPLRVINGGPAGGTIGVLAGPKDTASFRYDGTNFARDRALPDTSNRVVFNVRDFGAKGDEDLGDIAGEVAATHEAAAIQACFDAAAAHARDNRHAGAIVYFPAGQYYITGHPIVLPRTPYRSGLMVRGDGYSVSQIRNLSGDVFRAQSLAEEPDVTLGGEGWVIQDLGFISGTGYCLIWDLGDAGDFANDADRFSPHIFRCYFSRSLSPGPSVRLRRPSRARFVECINDVSLYFAGSFAFEVVKGSATFEKCRGGGSLIRCRDGGEIVVLGCRSEGGAGIPSWDFYACSNVVMIHTSNEGNDEADAMYRFEGIKQLTIDNVRVAGADRSWVSMRGTVPLTGAPTLTYSHVDATGSDFGPENKIVRSSGSWFDDKIGYSSKVKFNSVTNNPADWLTVIECNHREMWVKETLVAETKVAATGVGTMSTGSMILEPRVTFASGPKTLTRAAGPNGGAGSWIADGFKEGQTIATADALGVPWVTNPGPWTIANGGVTDLVLTVNEAVTSGTAPDGTYVRANIQPGGIVLRACAGVKIRNCYSGSFHEAGDLSRYGLEIDADCRDVDFDITTQIDDDVLIEVGAVNITGEAHRLSPVDWHSFNPYPYSYSRYYGVRRAANIEVEGLVIPVNVNETGDPPPTPAGLSVRYGPLDSHDAAACWFDPSDETWHLGFTDDETTLGSHLPICPLYTIGAPAGHTISYARNTKQFVQSFSTAALGDTAGFVHGLASGSLIASICYNNWQFQVTGFINWEPSTEGYYKAGTTWFGYAGGFLWCQASSTITQVNGVAKMVTPGGAVQLNGRVGRGVHKIDFGYAAFTAGGSTISLRFCSLPAKTRVVAVYADTTQTFLGGTISAVDFLVGTEDDPDAYILTHDVFTSIVTKGLDDADLGVGLQHATAIQGGHIPSWTAAKELRVKLNTTGDTLNHLTQGAVQVTVVVEYVGT